MRRGSDALETINAAANVIASAENRVSRPPKRRWGSCWSLYWCFGTHKTKRIGHADHVPEPPTTSEPPPNGPEPDRPFQPSSLATVPFAAPPSSPASFIPSEPPSPTHHASSLSLSANMYSPSGPASMYAVGPYTHEPQLVSPPVFSTFTTEPSTAPYTPPPESTHTARSNATPNANTAPPSPEVPFARLLEPKPGLGPGSRYPVSQYELFQSSYQLQPGSPVSHLISPISNSGTSSPFLDRELTPFFLGEILRRGLGGSGPAAEEGRSLGRQDSDVGPLPDMGRLEQDETCHETEERYQKSRTITLGSTKEFNFDTAGGVVSSDGWWANERISVEDDDEEDGKCSNNWSFFPPTIQTGLSLS